MPVEGVSWSNTPDSAIPGSTCFADNLSWMNRDIALPNVLDWVNVGHAQEMWYFCFFASVLCAILCSSSHVFQTHHCVSITQLFSWDCNSVYRNVLSNLDLEIWFSFVFSSWGSTFVVVHLVAVAQLQFAGFGSLLDTRMRCNLLLTKCATTFLAVMSCTHLTCQQYHFHVFVMCNIVFNMSIIILLVRQFYMYL